MDRIEEFHRTGHATGRSAERGLTFAVMEEVVRFHDTKKQQYRGDHGGFCLPAYEKHRRKARHGDSGSKKRGVLVDNRIHRMNAFVTKSAEAPTVEIDTCVSAVYIRFQHGAKVARTVACDNPGPVVTVDFDVNDEIVGVELIGVKEYGVGVLLQQARVQAPYIDVQGTRYVQTRPAMAEATR